MSRCYIVGAGEFGGFIKPQSDDYIIAADGGCDSLMKAGVTPNLIIGDCDSILNVPDGVEILKYNPVKDETDTLLAVNKAIELGYGEIWLFGCLGGRLDHTLANIQTLAHASEKGVCITAFAENCTVTAVTDSLIRFKSDEKGCISVLSFCDNSYGVDICGLKYTVNNGILSNKNPIGVSNEFIGKESSISVRKGTLIIIKERIL